MIRCEFVLVGVFAMFLGIALCIAGYRKTEPTPASRILGFVEGISGEQAPPDVKARLAAPKAEGYAFIAGGIILASAGIALMLVSRTREGASRGKEGVDRS